MVLGHAGVSGAKFVAGLIERGAGREAAEKFGHAMDPAGDHGRGKVMRAHHQVGDDFRVLRIRDAGFEDADHRAGAIADAAEPNRFADDRRIFAIDGGPEAMSKNDDAGGLRAVVLGGNQPAEDGAQAHYLEVGTADHAADHTAGLTEADHSERHAGEFAVFGDRVHAAFEVSQFGDGERRVFFTQAGSTLADVDQPVFAAIHEGFEQHAAHQREDGRVRADAQSQRQDDDCGETLGAAERMESNSQITQKRHCSSLPNLKVTIALRVPTVNITAHVT